jgi:ubiquinone/menaquinone biosynthesis C-methylase UbiE
MQAAADFWDRAAERYARAPVRDETAYAATLARVQAHLRATDRVLELGCGTGMTAVALAPQVAEYEGRDVSEKMLAIARKRMAADGPANLRFLPGDAAAVTADTPFDVVLAFNLLHLLPDLDLALVRIRSLLPPGGRFISKTPCLAATGLTPRYRALLWALPVLRLAGKVPRYFARLSVGELERRVAAAGFAIEDRADLPAMPPSRLIVARRPAA